MALVIGLAVLLLAVFALLESEMPSDVIPDGLGVNIHFSGQHDRDLDLVQGAGFRFIRDDFFWQTIEKGKGVYDFTPYDQLTDGLLQRGIRPLYILDYSNPLYETALSVRTEAGRQAFARWAAAAAARYRGKGVIWELWNEPDGDGFWNPQPSVNDYMALAKVALPAIRRADPDALRVAPAATHVPVEFLDACFRQGLLDMVEGVTVHPYRSKPPETVIPDILRLRALIARHCPDRPDLPIISGEWGYALARPWFNEQQQAAYLARQFLVNLSLGMPLSIWFCWNESGDDPLATDHYWGLITQDYQPKPVYREMQRLVAALGGTRFVKRLESASDDYLMLFSDGQRHVVAAWTAGDEHDTDAIPGQAVALTGNVRYLPVGPEKALVALAAWSAKARSVGVRAGAVPGGRPAPELEVRVRNPFAEPVQVRLAARGAKGLTGRFAERPGLELPPGESRTLHWRGHAARRSVGELVATVTADIGGWRSKQQVQFTSANPISLKAICRPDGRVTALLRNPGGDDFSGLLEARAGAASASYPIELQGATGMVSRGSPTPASGGSPEVMTSGSTTVVVLPLQAQAGKRIRISLRDASGVVAEDSVRIVPLRISTRTTQAVSDTDGKSPAAFELTDLDPDQALGAVSGAVRLAYSFESDSNWIRLAPARGLSIRGRPSEIGVWVRGDATYSILRQRFRDSGGRTFQPCFERLEFEGWRYITTQLDNPWLQSSGNPDNPHHISYPIRMDSFIMVDHRRRAISGHVEFAGFQLIYHR